MRVATDNREFEHDLISRLRRGEHLVLYGPCGSGKSTLLARLHDHFVETSVPCGLARSTACLDDISQALARAYPDVDVATTRRRALSRLRLAADCRAGVLLLDHVSEIHSAMLGLLRRLRGGGAAALLAVDVDVDRDLQRVRSWGLGTLRLAMPLSSPRELRKLFIDRCAGQAVPAVAPGEERRIVRAARGRPGWILECVRLLTQARYWRDGVLHVSTLCVDTEIKLRKGDVGLVYSDLDS
jgi:energy-coupling factor transporter ATP-binding protein EcfA2